MKNSSVARLPREASNRRPLWGALLVVAAAAGCEGKAAPAPLPTAPSTSSEGSVAKQVEAAAARASTEAPAEPETAVLDKLCTQICDHSRVLKCKAPDVCKPNCLAMASLTPCGDEFRAFYGCLVGQPSQNWECSEDGVAAIREGFCESQQSRVAACMNAKMQN
jgi:hypothetical protein